MPHNQLLNLFFECHQMSGFVEKVGMQVIFRGCSQEDQAFEVDTESNFLKQDKTYAKLDQLFSAFLYRLENWAMYCVSVSGTRFGLKEFEALVSFWGTGDPSFLEGFLDDPACNNEPVPPSTVQSSEEESVRRDTERDSEVLKPAPRKPSQKLRGWELNIWADGYGNFIQADGDPLWVSSDIDSTPLRDDYTNSETDEISLSWRSYPHWDSLQRDSSRDSFDGDCVKPALYAAQHGHDATIEAIYHRKKRWLFCTDFQGRGVIHYAAYFGRLEVIRALIKLSVPVFEFQDSLRRSAMHYAALAGHASTITLLFAFHQQLQSVDVQDIYHWTPLHYAAMNGHAQVIEVLLELGSRVLLPDLRQPSSFSPIHLAAKSGHVAVIEALSKENKRLIDDRSSEGLTAMHVAASAGKSAVVEALVRLGSRSLHALSGHHLTPLQLAASAGHAETVEALVKLGANPSSRPREKSALMPQIFSEKIVEQAFVAPMPSFHLRKRRSRVATLTPMHLAARGGHFTVIETLVRMGSSDIDSTSQISEYFREATPMHLAAMMGHVGVIETLARLGSKGIDKPDFLRVTPMHLAAQGGHVDVIEALVRLGSRSLDATDQTGITPLHDAVIHGQLNAITTLVKLGSRANNITNRHGWNLVHSAACKGEWAIFQAVVQLDTISFDLPDFKGWTPFHVAVVRKEAEIANALAKMGSRAIDVPVEFFRLLPRFAVEQRLNDATIRFYPQSFTALQLAAKNGQSELIEALVQLGSGAIDTCDAFGNAPLHYAAMFGHSKVIEALVRLGSQAIDSPNNDGWTPLHFACIQQSGDCIRTLMRLGCRAIDLPTNTGCSPILIAAKYGQFRFVETLIRLGSQAIDTPDYEGTTPMHIFALKGDARAIETLSNLGSRAIDRSDQCGWTPMHSASSRLRKSATIILYQLGSQASQMVTWWNETPFDLAWRYPRATTHSFCRMLVALGQINNVPGEADYLANLTEISPEEVLQVRLEVYFSRSLFRRLCFSLGVRTAVSPVRRFQQSKLHTPLLRNALLQYGPPGEQFSDDHQDEHSSDEHYSDDHLEEYHSDNHLEEYHSDDHLEECHSDDHPEEHYSEVYPREYSSDDHPDEF